ncbi:hypothetical protein C5167_033666 [Papaver somniferum]|uniref:Uncharacterized protein n=1 Tax=Papaver somniferum TaxID=3469 RepID=A0A4Y7KER9_PAPSO|nr:hypothetical protein C5167_033666 [Papaver somniferum]
MVCVFCLIPLFLIPIVNLLPILFDVLMARIYRLLGWEYRKPERVPPACPYKPSAAQKDAITTLLGIDSFEIEEQKTSSFNVLSSLLVGEDVKLMHEKMGVATDTLATAPPVDSGKQD